MQESRYAAAGCEEHCAARPRWPCTSCAHPPTHWRVVLASLVHCSKRAGHICAGGAGQRAAPGDGIHRTRRPRHGSFQSVCAHTACLLLVFWHCSICNTRLLDEAHRAHSSTFIICLQDQPDVSARLVIGSDGLRSGVRAALLPQDPGPRCWTANALHTLLLYEEAAKNRTRNERCGPHRYLGDMNWSAVVANPSPTAIADIPDGGLIMIQDDEDFFSSPHILWVYVWSSCSEDASWRKAKLMAPLVTACCIAQADSAAHCVAPLCQSGTAHVSHTIARITSRCRVVGQCEGGHLQWHFRMSSDQPDFTDKKRNAGGLGIAGCKARLQAIFERLGWEAALKTLQVRWQSCVTRLVVGVMWVGLKQCDKIY